MGQKIALRIAQLTFGVLGVLGGLYGGSFLYEHFIMHAGWSEQIKLAAIVIPAVILGIIGLLIAKPILRRGVTLTKWIEGKLQKMPIQDLMGGALGLIIGLIIATFIGYAFARVPFIGAYVPIVASIIFGYLGLSIGIRKREELAGLFVFLKRDREKEKFKDRYKNGAEGRCNRPKVLDTSVIIDGRIADICKTGFVEGPLVIPNFVLEELRHIADSSDALKRNRGRRGLDILNKIRKELDIEVQISSRDFDDISEVDDKLVKLAQEMYGCVVTNDYNLNKVAELQGVVVLNINELANAIKPVVLPGEEMSVLIIKDGKEQNQGVAYLDDGTMIVVENGRRYIGETKRVIVTSVIQTNAGRMIFAKPEDQ